MSGALCGVCNTQPKKYKCPTCSLPYCSLECFKTHKTTHSETSTAPSAPVEPTAPELPQPAPPAPVPRYIKKKTDFAILATSPKFQDLLKAHPTLLSSLQRVYAKTIEPDPEDEAHRQNLERQAFRGRGSRGRGRGRGRGGRWNNRDDSTRKWTQKKGDADAMRLLKGIREGKGNDREKEAMEEFSKLLEDTFGEEKTMEEGG